MSAISVTAWLLSAVAFAAINNGTHGYNMPHGGSGKNNNAHQNSLDDSAQSRPYFDISNSKNVTTIQGKTAYLNCRAKNWRNKTMTLQVSWIRHRDVHLLTIGQYTYTNDQRFKPIHIEQSEDWTLEIKYAQLRDSGCYECQISTTPHISHIVYLEVIEPKTEVLGEPDIYINRGSTINLTCILVSPEPPAYIIWNHNDAIITYDPTRDGVSVITEHGNMTRSFLLVQDAKLSDSGRYTCNPSNAQPKSITVHVLNGEYPAAMQHGGQAKQPRLYSLLLCLCLLLY